MPRNPLRRPAVWCLPLLAVMTLVGCTTTKDRDEWSEPSADEDEASPPAAVAPKNDGLALGKLHDDDLRELVHAALKARIDASDGQQSIELGDAESFKFIVTRLTAGKDDVSGGKADHADGLEVEVTGWYKQQARGEEPTCVSFDTAVPLARVAGVWQIPKEFGAVAYSRQDQEDCF